MEKEQPKTLSDKIEDTVEGVLRFVARFLRTTAVIFFRPWSCEGALLTDGRVEKRYVRPLTYLAIGGFVFSLTISVYPKGFLGLVNIIWFNEEVGQTLLNRWQEALSITGLLIAGFPILFTVATGANLAALTVRSSRRRDEFVTLNCYLFGYQCFLLFSFFFFAILGSVGRELMGVEVREVLGIENLAVSQRLTDVVIAGLIAVFLSALAMPTVALSLWAVRILRRREIWFNTAVCATICIYCLLMLAVCSYTASAPAAFKRVATPKPDEIKIHFLADPVVSVSHHKTTGNPVAELDLNVAIENVPTAHLIARRDDLTVGIVGEMRGQKDNLLNSEDFVISADGTTMNKVVIEKGRVGAYRLTGSVPIPAGTMELIRQKIEKPLENNHYSFFVNIRLRQDSKQVDRRLYLDTSKLLAAPQR